MSKTAAAITHTAAAGATSGLTISSDNGFVEVESVRITGGASKSDIGFGATDYHRAVCHGRRCHWSARRGIVLDSKFHRDECRRHDYLGDPRGDRGDGDNGRARGWRGLFCCDDEIQGALGKR